MMALPRGAQRQDWVTPRHVRDLLHKLWPSGFRDLATSAANPCGARVCHLPDGVVRFAPGVDPDERLPVWLNPPWQASSMRRWIDRFSLVCDEAGQDGVLCVPAVTDRAWWAAATISAPLVVTSRGRIRFADPATGEPGPQPPVGTAFCYRGRAPNDFLALFAPLGNVSFWRSTEGT